MWKFWDQYNKALSSYFPMDSIIMIIQILTQKVDVTDKFGNEEETIQLRYCKYNSQKSIIALINY